MKTVEITKKRVIWFIVILLASILGTIFLIVYLWKNTSFGCFLSRYHIVMVDKEIGATCTETGLTRGEHCERCDKVFVEQKVIPRLGHENVQLNAVEPTCTKIGLSEGTYCKNCNKPFKEQEIEEKLGHDYKNGVCEICGIDKVDYTDVSLYASTYGYDYLGKLENANELQAFYNDMNEELTAFHSGKTKNASYKDGDYIAAKINFGQYDLTKKEAQLVWNFYRKDHPLYYWIDSYFSWNLSKEVQVAVEKSYAKGYTRAKYNELIYKAIEKSSAIAEGETSEYQIALAYHDYIIDICDYAYNSEGEPEEALWAHSILGAFTQNAFVCEGYAKLFQLYLNFFNVENVYVTGESEGEGHAWNLVKLDDGKWYCFDLTWDDQPQLESVGGILYNHFVVNDNENLDGINSSYTREESFKKTHTPTELPWETDDWVNCLYELPIRSKTSFMSKNVLELTETFTVNGCIYALSGYDEVKLVQAKGKTSLYVPELVAYNGRVYTVVGACALNEDGLFSYNRIVAADAEIIYLPKSLKYISEGAFRNVKVVEV